MDHRKPFTVVSTMRSTVEESGDRLVRILVFVGNCLLQRHILPTACDENHMNAFIPAAKADSVEEYLQHQIVSILSVLMLNDDMERSTIGS